MRTVVTLETERIDLVQSLMFMMMMNMMMIMMKFCYCMLCEADLFRKLMDIYGLEYIYTRVGTLIVATIYLQLIQNRNMFRSFTVLQCSHQHCVQPVASDVEVVGYL